MTEPPRPPDWPSARWTGRRASTGKALVSLGMRAKIGAWLLAPMVSGAGLIVAFFASGPAAVGEMVAGLALCAGTVKAAPRVVRGVVSTFAPKAGALSAVLIAVGGVLGTLGAAVGLVDLGLHTGLAAIVMAGTSLVVGGITGLGARSYYRNPDGSARKTPRSRWIGRRPLPVVEQPGHVPVIISRPAVEGPNTNPRPGWPVDWGSQDPPVPVDRSPIPGPRDGAADAEAPGSPLWVDRFYGRRGRLVAFVAVAGSVLAAVASAYARSVDAANNTPGTEVVGGYAVAPGPAKEFELGDRSVLIIEPGVGAAYSDEPMMFAAAEAKFTIQPPPSLTVNSVQIKASLGITTSQASTEAVIRWATLRPPPSAPATAYFLGKRTPTGPGGVVVTVRFQGTLDMTGPGGTVTEPFDVRTRLVGVVAPQQRHNSAILRRGGRSLSPRSSDMAVIPVADRRSRGIRLS